MTSDMCNEAQEPQLPKPPVLGDHTRCGDERQREDERRLKLFVGVQKSPAAIYVDLLSSVNPTTAHYNILVRFNAGLTGISFNSSSSTNFFPAFS